MSTHRRGWSGGIAALTLLVGGWWLAWQWRESHRPRITVYEEVQKVQVTWEAPARAALGIEDCVLVGHSDGASIALLYAARAGTALAGLIVMAPHILVEEVTVSQIEQARSAYLHTDLRERLARYHDQPDSAFGGWNTIWLDARFRDWSIESELAAIACPLLAVQGLDDPYGTLEQIHGIARRVPQTELLELGNCGHSPHRDQADRLIARASAFIQQQTGDKP